MVDFEFANRSVVFAIPERVDLPALDSRKFHDADQDVQARTRVLPNAKYDRFVTDLEDPIPIARRIGRPAAKDLVRRGLLRRFAATHHESHDQAEQRTVNSPM